MATYLQGITDYIPRIQPFKPDYNFYQKALETKESQYKAGYDKISNLYGMMLNSAMTREPDLEKRDKFFQQVQNDIQKLSTVDLSLEENVNSAYRIFQPIINDKNITHDIAWTKKYQTQTQRSQILKNCFGDEEKCGGKWWGKGDQELQYKRQEYANADDATALGMSAPTYTPYTDISAKLNKIAKDYGVEVESVTHTRDGYNITTTNGQQVTPKLRNLFTAAIKNDPRAQAVYKTEGYLERKNWVAQNAESFKGGEQEAESVYLNDKIRLINESMSDPKKQVTLAIDLLTSQINVIDDAIVKKGIPESKAKVVMSTMDTLMAELGINTATKEHLDATTDPIKPSELLGLDNASKIARVDAAMAGAKMTMDMARYAQNWADLHRKVSKEADPYDKMRMEHNLALDMEDKKQLHSLERISFTEQVKNKATGASTGWRKADVSPGATSKSPFEKNTNADAVSYAYQTRASSFDYHKTLYNKLFAVHEHGTPAEKRNAEKALLEVYSGKDGKGGYLNPDFTLKYGSWERNPDINNSASFDSWENLYTRAQDITKKGTATGLEGVDLIDAGTATKLDNDASTYNYTRNVRDALAKTYVDNKKKVYDYIKYYGKSEFKDDADLANTSGSFTEFNEKFLAKYPGEVDVEDAQDAWEELTEEFSEVYAENPTALNLKSTRPGSSGSGVVAPGMEATFNGSALGQDQREYLHSIKADLNNPSSKVFLGTNTGVGEGDTPVSELEGDPGAKAAVNYVISELLAGRSKESAPIATIRFDDVGGNDRNLVAITVSSNEAWANKARGTEKKPTSAEYFYRDGVFSPDATIYVDKDQAKNLMHARSKHTPEEILVQNGGKIVLDNFKRYGGTVEIGKDDNGIYSDGWLNYVNDDGSIGKTPFRQYAATDNVAEFRKTLLEILKVPSRENIKETWNILQSQKKYFTKEELNQALQTLNTEYGK